MEWEPAAIATLRLQEETQRAMRNFKELDAGEYGENAIDCSEVQGYIQESDDDTAVTNP